MKSLLPGCLVASLLLPSVAQAVQVVVLTPAIAASVHDEPVDGLGDSFNNPPFEGLIRTQSNRADRALHEYDVTGLAGQQVSAAVFNGRVSVNNSADNGVRSFDFLVYDANGSADLSDYQVSAIVVGNGSYHPPIDTFFDYQIDATSVVQALVAGGATHVGLRVEGTSSPSFPNILDANLATLDITLGGGPPSGVFCAGDGSATACPCGNVGAANHGCANSFGAQGAFLGGFGSFGIAAADSGLAASGLVPNQPGLYFQGDNALNGGQGVIFGDGLRCAGGNITRLEIAIADAGGVSFTTQDLASSGGVSAGETKRYQCWYRDPVGSPCGSAFNLSNGFEVTWMP